MELLGQSGQDGWTIGGLVLSLLLGPGNGVGDKKGNADEGEHFGLDNQAELVKLMIWTDDGQLLYTIEWPSF